MEFTVEHNEIAKRIKSIIQEMDNIHYELESIEMLFYNEKNKDEQARLLGECDFLDSKLFSLQLERDDLIRQLNAQGITEITHPHIFPTKKPKLNTDYDENNTDLPF
jgi:hypothetical protein